MHRFTEPAVSARYGRLRDVQTPGRPFEIEFLCCRNEVSETNSAKSDATRGDSRAWQKRKDSPPSATRLGERLRMRDARDRMRYAP